MLVSDSPGAARLARPPSPPSPRRSAPPAASRFRPGGDQIQAALGPLRPGRAVRRARALFLLAAALFARPAGAEPVALVIDAAGEIAPALAPFDEVEAGTRLTLGAEAEATLSHYASCEEIRVRGGQVLVAADRLSPEGGQVLERTGGDCPTALQLTETEVSGAVVVFRSISVGRKIGLTPGFAVIAEPGRFQSVAIRAPGGAEVASLPVVGRRADWPGGTAPLVAGGDYVVELVDPTGRYHASRVRAEGAGPDLLILRP